MSERTREERLNDYIDGLLSDAEARAVEAELERDAAFRAEEVAMRAIVYEAGRLPKGIAPQRDLWPDIDARLVERSSPLRKFSAPGLTRFARGITAAAAAAAIFVAGMWYARHSGNEPGAPPVGSTVSPAGGAVELASFPQIESEYAGVRSSLRAAVEKARPTLAPDTVKVVDENLAIIDQAINDIEGALAKDPANQTLIRSLVAAYDQEVGLLRQVAEIAEQPREEKA